MRQYLTHVAIVTTVLIGSFPAANAQGLYLTWNDCASGATAASNLGFDCGANTEESHLVAALVTSQPVDSVLGMEIVVDVQHSSSTMPDWWGFDVEACRDGSLRGDGNFTGLTGCANPWLVAPSGGLFSYSVGQPYGGANQARIRITLSVPTPQMMTLTPGLMYYAARIVLDHQKTTGGGACLGCGEGACLVLNTVFLRRPPRPVGSGDVVLDLPGPSNANWATWQSGSMAGCQAVPVKNMTWGAVKSLYR